MIKFLYVNGHEDLYADTFEFLLPAGCTYKILDIFNCLVGKLDTTCYVVELVGVTNGDLTINTSFDKKYEEYIVPILNILGDNEKKDRKYQISVHYKDNIYWYPHEIGHFEYNDSLYLYIIERYYCSTSFTDINIIQSIYFYIQCIKTLL